MSEPAHLRRLKKELIRYNISVAEDAKKGTLCDYYYFADSSDMSIGYALIVGPTDTPYEGGFYVIKIKFPNEYPHAPPKCQFMTLSGIRQSPNLYEDGKVCLSVIGTWGESTYKSTMGFHQIIMSIVGSVMTKNALDCEPPYDYSRCCGDKLENSKNYDEIVRYANFRYNTYQMYHTPPVPEEHIASIREIIVKRIKQRIEWYVGSLVDLVATKNGKLVACSVYPTTVNGIKFDYSAVLEQFTAFVKSSSDVHDIDSLVLAARKKVIKAAPKIPSDDEDTWRRIRVVEFKPALVGDSNLNNKPPPVKILVNKTPPPAATVTAPLAMKPKILIKPK